MSRSYSLARTTPARGADATPVETASLPGGRQVAYAEYGAPDGTPVVFLHGTPGSRLLGALFDEDARRRGVRLLAPDRPGYGRSSPWPGRTLVDTGAFVAAVLADADVGRAGVVGFSGGGPHALALAATCGDLVGRVDVVSGAVPPSIRSRPPVPLRLVEALAGRAPRLLTGLVGVQRWVAERAPPEFVVSQYTAPGGAGDVPDGVAELVWRDFVEAVADPSGFVTESRLLAEPWGVSPTDVTGEVRLWHGTRDANVPVDGARRLGDRLPDARLTAVEGADHLHALLERVPRILDGHASAAD